MTDIVPLPLPNQIVNGQLADADPLMDNLNYIAAQVNANAQFAGGGISANIEWTLLSGAPTYLTATTFEMQGDVSTDFIVGRRIRSTNTAGTVYSIVVGCVVALNSTITVVNTSGVLDSGMSDVSIGTLNSVDPSLPAYSNLYTNANNTNAIILAASATTAVGTGGFNVGDALSEWTTGTQRFTPKYAGNYAVTINSCLDANGANITVGMLFAAYIYVNGIINAQLVRQSWPFASGVQSNLLMIHGTAYVAMTLGDYLDVRIQTPAFTTASMFSTTNLIIRRVLYP